MDESNTATADAYNDAIYVFDLDGVITDPRDSTVDEVVVAKMSQILQQGGHIAVNTGRSFVWVQEHLVIRLQSMADTGSFDRLYIVCEKGGESRIWQDKAFVSQPSRFALPADVVERAHTIYTQHQAELHTMSMQGMVMKMRPISGVDIPAGHPVSLKPAGEHIMLMGLNAPLKVGDSVPLKLKFGKAGEITVQVTVEALGTQGASAATPGQMPAGDAAMHKHQHP